MATELVLQVTSGSPVLTPARPSGNARREQGHENQVCCHRWPRHQSHHCHCFSPGCRATLPAIKKALQILKVWTPVCAGLSRRVLKSVRKMAAIGTLRVQEGPLHVRLGLPQALMQRDKPPKERKPQKKRKRASTASSEKQESKKAAIPSEVPVVKEEPDPEDEARRAEREESERLQRIQVLEARLR